MGTLLSACAAHCTASDVHDFLFSGTHRQFARLPSDCTSNHSTQFDLTLIRVLCLTQVSVAEEEDEFQLVVTACLSVLILGCETKLDAALLTMTRMPWASLEAVGNSCPSRSSTQQ